VKVEFVPTQCRGSSRPCDGKFDTIISGMGITAERALKVNFTMPTITPGCPWSLTRNWQRDLRARGFQQVRGDDRRADGATPVAAVKKFMPKAKMRQFDRSVPGLQELLNGNAHAVVGSAPCPSFRPRSTRISFHAGERILHLGAHWFCPEKGRS